MTEGMLAIPNNRFENLFGQIEKLRNTVTQMAKSVEDLTERVTNLEFKIEVIENGYEEEDRPKQYKYNKDLMDEEADRYHAITPNTKRNPYQPNPYEFDEQEWGEIPQQSSSTIAPTNQTLSPNTSTGTLFTPRPPTNDQLRQENAELKKQCAELNVNMDNLASNMHTIMTELQRLKGDNPTTQL